MIVEVSYTIQSNSSLTGDCDKIVNTSYSVASSTNTDVHIVLFNQLSFNGVTQSHANFFTSRISRNQISVFSFYRPQQQKVYSIQVNIR